MAENDVILGGDLPENDSNEPNGDEQSHTEQVYHQVEEDVPDHTMRNIIIATLVLVILICCCCILFTGALVASGVLNPILQDLGINIPNF